MHDAEFYTYLTSNLKARDYDQLLGPTKCHLCLIGAKAALCFRCILRRFFNISLHWNESAKSRGLRGKVSYVDTWVAWVRGSVGYVGQIFTWVAWVTWVKMFFTWVIIFTRVALVKYIFARAKVFCVGKNFFTFLRRSEIFAWVIIIIFFCECFGQLSFTRRNYFTIVQLIA